MNNIVSSGDNLFKWKINDSDKCQFCNDKDTLLHCLWECPKSKYWLENCLLYVSNENESYEINSTIEYLLGRNNAPLDHILLFTKFFIWKIRFYSEKFYMRAYKSNLKYRILLEKGCLSDAKSVKKWSSFKHL